MRGENQGLQIAVITFVMTTIFLSVTTFLFYRQAEEAEAAAATAQAAASEANTKATTLANENMRLKEISGFSPDETIDNINSTLSREMAELEQLTIPQDKQNYRDALRFTLTALRDRDARLAAADTEIATLKAQNQAYKAQIDVQLQALQQQASEAEKLAQQRHQEKVEADNLKNEQLGAMQKRLDEQVAEADKKAKEQEEEIKRKGEEVAKLTQNVQLLDEKIDQLDPHVFEDPDGEIRWVNQRTRTVWINLGHADNLRRQTTFSVVAAGEHVVLTEKRKGRIEVTQILGEHLAEARILEDDVSDPIVPGDQVYTPLWHPGRQVHFAIAGFIDVDGDGRDDRDVIVTLIEMSGGVIDEQLMPDGTRAGPGMTVDTRYLIFGKSPETAPPPGSEEAEEAVPAAADGKVLHEEYANMLNDAKKLGIELINVEKFLQHIGWKDPKQVLRYGARGNANAVPPRQPDGGRPAARGSVSDVFERRHPGKKAAK
ncbi:MAG: hypothetical protein K6T86_18410 [Pirellulales bacterium]|nr:hypothetical protein [Pirellulales bacterium]